MNHLSEKDLDLLQRLLRSAPRGGSLSAIADSLGSSPSLLSRTLKRLVEAGWVAREVVPTNEGREVHYRALHGIDIRWVDSDAGIATSWTAPDVDWEFPLVSRIPDADARASIVGYLRALRGHGILDAPWKTTAVKDRGPMLEHLGVAVVVIGSAATGRMDRASDVDLVVVMSDEQGYDLWEQVGEIAAEISLTTPRAVQARKRSIDDIAGSEDIISNAVRTNGVMIYDSIRKPSGGKDASILRLVEGNRK